MRGKDLKGLYIPVCLECMQGGHFVFKLVSLDGTSSEHTVNLSGVYYLRHAFPGIVKGFLNFSFTKAGRNH